MLVGKIYYDTYTIEVHHYQIANCRLADALAGKKVAFVSDLHSMRFGARENEVLSILEREKPDLVFLGGDYISFCGPYEPVFSFLGNLKNAYAVMGNTEYSNENGSCLVCHKEKSLALKENPNVRFLRNSHLTLESGGKKVNLLGVDGPIDKRDDITEAMHSIDGAVPAILLAHSPEVFDDAVRRGIDLVLCGHNHGGQIFPIRFIKGKVMIDPTFDYLVGFFNRGNTLMYVSRGVGNSYLPFRLGVKPEVAVFEFSGQAVQNGSTVTYGSTDGVHAGFSFSNIVDIFNFALPFRKPYEKKHVISPEGRLFDFETEAEMQYLDWECHKWFELSDKHATSGKYSLRVTLPPGQYPGIYFKHIDADWTRYRTFKMDIFNPSSETFAFHVRIDDHKSGWEYEDRFDRNFKIQNGMNNITIPLESVKANITPRSLDLMSIERVMFFIPGNDKKREFYIDNLRLE